MRVFSHILYFAAIAMVSACAKTELSPAASPDKEVSGKASFRASMEAFPATGSKAIIGTNDSGKPQTYWEDGDTITLYSSKGAVKNTMGFAFGTALSENSSSATFTYDGEDFPSGAYFAIYPCARQTRTVNFTSLAMAGVDVPSSQSLVAGGFDRLAAVAIAYAEEGSSSLEFNNCVALIKFRVSDSDVVSGRIETGESDYISGRFRATVNSSTHVSSLNTYGSSERNNYVDFNIDGGSALATGTDYYVAVRPSSLTSDLKIYLDGILVKTISAGVLPSLDRNTIYNLGVLSKPNTEKIVLSFDFSGSALSGWPTAGTGDALSCVYPLNGYDYGFYLSACGNASKRSILWTDGKLSLAASKRYLGLPSINGYALSKIVCTDATSAGSSNPVVQIVTGIVPNTSDLPENYDGIDIVSGGDSQEWATPGADYTYTLTGTAGGTMYYLYTRQRGCGISNLVLTYDRVSENADDYLWVVSDGATSSSIRTTVDITGGVASFTEDIQKATGVLLSTVDGGVTDNTVTEIVIGKETDEVSHGYVIKVAGNKIVIAGTDAAWTVLGMEYFARRILSNSSYCRTGMLRLPKDFAFVYDKADPQLVALLLSRGRDFDLVPEVVGNCPRETGFTVAQGAASDGKYVYFCLKGGEDSETHDSNVRVYQYTLQPFSHVAVSETFNAHHANDMTFDTKSGRVLVIHGSGGANLITAIPAGDTGFGGPYTITTSLGIGGITYNAKNNIYGITQGGTKFQTINSDTFEIIKNIGRSDGMKDYYTAQGMGSDDSYVYYPMSPNSTSPENVNILVACDWSGNYIRNLKIPLALESESMFYAAGDYYVNFYQNGATLYRVYPALEYRSQIGE
ncbi:MAG: hypothetical protein IJQ93_11475 [Bacteroidales bacterium]|nr:hypothetical protein [Bacteroidales bacterium]